MSKKNNRATRARLHKFDLEREKAAAQISKVEAAKKDRQVVAGRVQKTKVRGLRVRKGVVIKGIKVVDAETKKKVKKLLSADAAARLMDVEQEGQRPPKAGPLKAIKKKLKVDGVAKSAARRAAAADSMDQD